MYRVSTLSTQLITKLSKMNRFTVLESQNRLSTTSQSDHAPAAEWEWDGAWSGVLSGLMRFRLKARCLNIVSHGSWVSELSATPEARSPNAWDHATLDRLHLPFLRFYVALFDRAGVEKYWLAN